MRAYTIFAAAALFATGVTAQVTVVNGASLNAAQPLAPGAFATAFGQNLCAQTMPADWVAPGQLPTTLGGCSVAVNGTPAMMQYVSPEQVNFVMPNGVATGQATVTISNGAQIVSGSVASAPAAPGMFTLTAMGVGEAAMMNAAMWRTGPFSTSTNGQPTFLAIYATGLDVTTTPTVAIGGMPVGVMWAGNVPGYPGLQQVNVTLPSSMAGVGRVPVMITSGGQPSNVTFMHVLPTTSMMAGTPGWGAAMMVGENMARAHEMSDLAVNAARNAVLVADEDDDVLRVISLGSNSTIATITLPSGSQAHGVAVNATGTMAAVALSAKAAVALVDLTQNRVSSVVGTGYYPSRVAFAGSNLLATNSASGTVSVLDTASGTLTRTVTAGAGASGIAIAGNTAVVANMQADSVSLIDLTTYAVSTLPLPAASRPHEVAISTASNKAVITAPMSNSFFILDLGTRALTPVLASAWNGMGPRAVATDGNNIYVANQMTATVSVTDMSGNLIKSIAVDPGPVSMALVPGANKLVVLAEGLGTIDVVDLSSYSVIARVNAGDTERLGQFSLPVISSVSPNSAPAGSTVTMTINGTDLAGVQGINFALGTAMGMGGGMMGGSGLGAGQSDPNVTVTNIQVNAAGTQLTATVQIAAGAVAGTRQIRMQTAYAPVMAMMTNSVFTVTK